MSVWLGRPVLESAKPYDIDGLEGIALNYELDLKFLHLITPRISMK